MTICKTQTRSIVGDLIECPPNSCTTDEDYQLIQTGKKIQGSDQNPTHPEKTSVLQIEIGE